eukprot:3535864-Pyramimonas_sp.AAC.1
MELLASIGSFISSSACPWLIGADFNLEPAEAQGSQFVQELRGGLLVPAICTHYPTGPPTTSDYFVVSCGLAKGIFAPSAGGNQ